MDPGRAVRYPVRAALLSRQRNIIAEVAATPACSEPGLTYAESGDEDKGSQLA